MALDEIETAAKSTRHKVANVQDRVLAEVAAKMTSIGEVATQAGE